MKKALSIVLSLMLLLAVVPVGTISAGALEDNVIEIRTIAELYNINNNMSGNYKLMNDIDMTEDTAVGGDWDFMGNGWEPIGSNGIYSNTSFTGTFDGDGHKIIGMRIEVNTKPSGTGTVYLGLFANNSGTIINLGIDETSVLSNGNYSGGICAYNSGTISNCYNKADISLSIYSGGICGYSQSGGFNNCYNTGNISSVETNMIPGYINARYTPYTPCSGGICGYTYSGEFNNCYNTGNISCNQDLFELVESISTMAYSYSGGICGDSRSIVNNCFNTGSVTSSANNEFTNQYANNNTEYYKSNAYCGGICGSSSKNVNNCFNTGNVSSSSSVEYSISYSDGVVYSDALTYCGGICGTSSMNISNCYNTGGLSSSLSSTANNSFRSSSSFSSQPSTRAASYCDAYMGGVCGDQTSGTISNCYNTADITSTEESINQYYHTYSSSKKYYYDSTATSSTGSKSKNIGGIAGASKGEINGCYNVGEATFGIRGTANGSIINCYYLSTAGYSNTGAKALTAAQLQLEMCMPDFDFENTWVIYNQTEYKYPQLRANIQEVEIHLESIEITLPEKTLYIVGEKFETIGMVVMGHYSNGTTQEINSYNISGFTGELGRNNITVKVGEKSAVFFVTVHDEGEWTTTKEPTCTEKGEKKLYCTDCGELIKTEEIPAKGHTEVTDKGHEATCTESGLTDGSHCSVCHTILAEQEVIPAKGHTPYQNWETIKNPTCISHGEKVRRCSVCGEVAETANIDVTDHQVVIDESKAATCLTSGLTEGSHCSVCHTVLVPQEVIQPKGHQWDEGEIVKQPTCTTAGEKLYHCKNCEQTKTETLSVLGHNFSDEYTVDKAATCTQDGEKSKHCSRCEAVTDVTVIEKHGHDWDDGTVTKKPTCIVTGEKVYHCQKCEQTKTETVDALGHNFSDEYTIDKPATCTQDGEKSRHCSRCEAVTDVIVIEKHGHSWDDGTVTKLPTCTATGEKVYQCKNCDKTYTETLSALGHNFSDEFTIDKEATCNQDGSKSRHCSRCNAVTEVTTIEKHNHIWDDGIVTKKPTCTTEGIKTYYCQKCEQTRTEAISVLGHKFSDEYTVDKAATCTQDGIKSRHCSRCEAYTDEVVIEKLGHNFSDEFTVDKEATCTEDGSKSRHCSRCDACTDETIIEKHGHDWNDGTVTKQPTCTTTGEKVYNCKNCEQTKTETLYALGHNFSDEYTVDKAATCTEDGLKSRHCTRCEAHTDEVVIEKHGHHTELVSNHAATYFAAGYSGDETCIDCGTVITKGKAIAKLKLATPKVKITAGKQKLTVKYTKVKDATGFQVKYIYKGKTKTKTYTSKKSITKIIKKLKKGTYKVSVRALIKSKGKTAYSKWTTAKKVKIK